MKQTAAGISTREHLVDLANEWMKKSEETLKKWVEEQNGIITRRIAAAKQQMDLVNQRMANIQKIGDDAKAKHQAYVNALHR